MSATISRNRVRMLVEVTERQEMQDLLSGGLPHIWRGNDASFEFAFTFGGEIASTANWASMTLEVKATRTGAALMSKTVASFTGACTVDSFTAGTDAQVTFAFTKEETALVLSGDTGTFYLVVSCLTTDSPSHEVTYGWSTLTVEEDGAGGEYVAPEVGPVAEITAEDSPYTVPMDVGVVLVDSTDGSVAVNLPAAPVNGQRVTVKDLGAAGSHNVTVAAAVAIDAFSPAVLNQAYDFLTVVWSASKGRWFVISRKAAAVGGGGWDGTWQDGSGAWWQMSIVNGQQQWEPVT